MPKLPRANKMPVLQRGQRPRTMRGRVAVCCIAWLDLETLFFLVISTAPFIVGNFRDVWNLASLADDSLRL